MRCEPILAKGLAILLLVGISTASIFPMVPGLIPEAQQSKIKLVLKVKDPDGWVGGARVNVWHNDWSDNLTKLPGRPPNYQDQTNVNGEVEFEVPTSQHIYYEVNKDELNATGKITTPPTSRKLSAVRYVVVLQKVDQQLIKVDKKDIVNLKMRVVGELEEDQTVPLSGVRLVFRYTGSLPIQFESSTDANGNVLAPAIATDYSVDISKPGYQSANTTVRLDVSQRGKTVTIPTVKLKKAKATDRIALGFRVQNEKDNNVVSGARVMIQSVLNKRVYSGSTNQNGEIEIPIEETGVYEVEVSQDNFETLSENIDVRPGEKTVKIPAYFLKEKKKAKETDEVSIKVVAGDKNRAPIRGASVKVGNMSVSTDENGVATVSTSFGLETGVSVTAAASGYKSETRTVPVRRGVNYFNAAANATFVLQPGEDPASDESPIKITVEVRDPAGEPVTGARVEFRSEDGEFLYSEATNAAGERAYSSSDSFTVELAKQRKGIRVNVTKSGFIGVINRNVPSNLIQPSNTPGRYRIDLDRDWTELEKDLQELSSRIMAWNANQRGDAILSTADNLFIEMSEFHMNVNKRIGEILTFPKDSCRNAAALPAKVEGYRASAAAKENELASLLSTAKQKADSCKVAADAALIKANYQSAIRLLGEIGAIEKKAVSDVNGIVAEVTTRSEMVAEVKKRLSDVNEQFKKAESRLKLRESEILKNIDLARSQTQLRTSLLAELSAIKVKYKTEQQNIGLSASARKTIDQLQGILSTPVDPATRPAVNRAQNILNDLNIKLTTLRNLISLAEKHGNAIEAEKCDVEQVKPKLSQISDIMASATMSIGLAADLPRQADACAAGSACRSKIAELTAAIDAGNLGQAEALLANMNGLGCDTAPLKRRIDADIERDAANALTPLIESCRFEDAVNFSRSFPASVQSRPTISRLIAKAQSGVQAERRIIQLIDNADRSNDLKAAKANIAEARNIAAPYPCLAGSIKDPNLPPVSVEELPEDLNPAPKPKNTPKTTSVEPPLVEDIPEDLAPVTPRNTGRNVPKIPIKTTEDDEQNTGVKPPPNPRPNPPQDNSCTAKDLEVWQNVVGTWQAKYGYVTFSGSCGNVTGFWMQGTYGHALRKDGTDQRGEIKEGRVKGGVLVFQFFQPWGDQRKGSDSCYLYLGEKQLSCSYLEKLSR